MLDLQYPVTIVIIEFYDSVAEGEAFILYSIGNLTHVRSIDVRWKM